MDEGHPFRLVEPQDGRSERRPLRRDRLPGPLDRLAARVARTVRRWIRERRRSW